MGVPSGPTSPTHLPGDTHPFLRTGAAPLLGVGASFRNLPEVDIRVLNKIIPDLLFDLRSVGEAFEDIKQMGLSGASG